MQINDFLRDENGCSEVIEHKGRKILIRRVRGNCTSPIMSIVADESQEISAQDEEEIAEILSFLHEDDWECYYCQLEDDF